MANIVFNIPRLHPLNIDVEGCVRDRGGQELLRLIRRGQPQQNNRSLINAYFMCLARTLELKGQYKGECESLLKNRIYQFATAQPTQNDVLDISRLPQFEENPKLKNVIGKVVYLAKGRIRNKNGSCGCCRLNNTKFSHHLSKIYRDGHSIAIGLSSALTGAFTLALAGTTQLITNEAVKNYLGIPPVIAGAGILLFPIIETFRSSSGKNP